MFSSGTSPSGIARSTAILISCGGSAPSVAPTMMIATKPASRRR